MATYADMKQQNPTNSRKMQPVLKEYKRDKENESNNNNNNDDDNDNDNNDRSKKNGEEITNIWEINRSDIVDPTTATYEQPTADERRQNRQETNTYSNATTKSDFFRGYTKHDF